MAAILKLRRGTTTPTLVESELFFNSSTNTLVVGQSSGNHTLVKIGSNVGDISFSGDITATNLTLTGNATVNGNITFGGSLITLGDSDTDDIVFTGELSSSLIPNNDAAFDIGSESKRYKTLYAVSASIESISLPGTGILSSSLQDFNTYSSSIESQLDSIYTFTQSADLRLTSIEGFTQSVDLRVDSLEASQSYFDNTFSASVDLRLDNAESTGSDHESRIDVIETTFSSSVDLRLDNAELTGSDHESRVLNLESTGSDHESRVLNLESTGSDHETRIDSLEFFSSSEYQNDSSSFDDRIRDLRIDTGSYATTGSNTFIGNQTITGSIIGSGSVAFNSIPWPSVGSKSHLFKTDPYVGQFTSGDRNYSYLGVALEQVATASYYENSLLIYTYDDHDNPTYGSELNVGPLRSHFQVLASGSGNLGNISLQDVEDGTTRGLIYADDIQIGVFTGSVVTIGNGATTTTIDGTLLSIKSPTSSSSHISASAFIGNGSQLTHNGTGILSSSLQDFTTFSSSVDSRLDTIEGPLSSSIDQQLNSIHSYTSSLKNSIDVSGTNLTVYGNLTVQGTQTSLNTNDLIVEDKLIAIASGSLNSAQADGAGIYISGADASMVWEDVSSHIVFNQSVSSSVGFYGDGSQLTNLDYTNIIFDGSGIVSGSSQIDLTGTTNYISGIKDRLNADGVFSSSAQVDATNIQNFDTNVVDAINDENVHSGSYLGTATTSNLTEGSNQYYTQARVQGVIDSNNVISGSTQITDGSNLVSSSEQISNYNVFLEINGDSVVSGSSQVDLTGTTNYISGIKDRLNIETVISGSSQVTQSLDTRYLEINGDSVVSGSSQISFNGIIDKPTLVSGSSQIDITQTSGYTSFSQSLDGRLDLLEGDQHTHSNKANLDTIDQNLSTTDSPTFTNLSLSTLNTLGSGELNAVFSGSAGTLGVRSLGTAAFYHVSQSISQEDDNVIGTAGAMKRYIDDALIAVGAGDITKVTAGDGISGGADSGEAIINLDTGSIHFGAGVINALTGSGIVSSSTQIDSLGFLQVNGDGILSSSVQDFDTFSGSVDSRLDTLEGETHENPLTFNDTTTIDLVRTGDTITANVIGGIVSSSAQISAYNTFLEINGDNVVSGSSQLTSSLDSRYLEINGDSVVSGSQQVVDLLQNQDVDFGTGDIIATNITGSTLNLDNNENVLIGNTVARQLDLVSSGQNIGIGKAALGGNSNFGSQNADGNVAIGHNALIKLQNNGNLNVAIGYQSLYSNTNGASNTALGPFSGNNITSGDYNIVIGATAGTSITTGDNNIVIGLVADVQAASDFNSIVIGSGSVGNGSNTVVIGNDDITSTELKGELTASGHFVPSQHEAYDLGSPTQRWRTLYISGSTIDLGGTLIQRDSVTGNINFIDSGSLNAVSAQVDYSTIVNKPTLISGSSQVNADTITNFDTNVKDKLNAEGIVSGSDQLTGSLVDKTSDQTISGTKTFQDIVVNGTGSFAYIQSVTGSAKIIGDSHVVLNASTPSSRYAGLSVYDSGSSISTASFQFDGQTNDWHYEYSGSSGTDYAVALFGPEYSTIGNPTYPTENRILKAHDNHHMIDSNISDTGTLITLDSNTQVNGNISLSGTVDGVDVAQLNTDFNTLKGKTLVSGSSQVNHDSTTGFVANEHIDHTSVTITAGNGLTGGGTIAASRTFNVGQGDGISVSADSIAVDATVLRTTGDSVISGSAQVSLGGDLSGTANSATVTKVQGVSLTSGEATQLANIDSTTISSTQWGYVGALNQGLTTTSTVQFGKVGVGGASDATYELKVTGDIGATGDVVAYISSDRRLKDEITQIPNALEKINQIGGYSFVWNENQNTYKGKDYGVIAQEIESILPELVTDRETGYKAVKYDRIVSLLIEGIKELSSEVNELKEKLK